MYDDVFKSFNPNVTKTTHTSYRDACLQPTSQQVGPSRITSHHNLLGAELQLKLSIMRFSVFMT